MLRARDEAKLSERFGALIYRLREAKKLSQRSAARMMGISQTRLVSLENGRDRNTGRPTLPSPELTARIASAYQVPKQQLLLLAGYLPWVLEEAEAEPMLVLATSAAQLKFDKGAIERMREFLELPPEQQRDLLSQRP